MSSRPGAFTRREVLTGAAAAIAGATRPARAQTPRRGGVFRLALGDPPHFDPHLTLSWGTFIALSFTHSRLLKHKAGPGVVPGTFQLEGDLAESWAQTGETTYVFKLRRGVRWHRKPPVNGRELTADDVTFSLDRFLGASGNPNRTVLEEIDKVDALDRDTVRVSLKAPFAWFLDAVAATTAPIVAREAVHEQNRVVQVARVKASPGVPAERRQRRKRSGAKASSATRGWRSRTRSTMARPMAGP